MYPYYGRLEEIEFLERLYDLEKIESNDIRYKNAKEDIVSHIRNNDYSFCWVFQDERFELKNGTDEVYLRFICEIFHPYVRDKKKQWEQFYDKVNSLIKEDGYELYVKERISGRKVYGYRLFGVSAADKMDKEAIRDLIDKFKSELIAKATDGDMSEKSYKQYRDILVQVPELKSHIPSFIMNNASAYNFRGSMQAYNPHYKERRALINSEMDKLYDYLYRDTDSLMQMNEFTDLEEVGSGGFGIVYKYHNDWLDMDFAVKIYEPVFASQEQQNEGEKRFFREAKMLFSLNSSYIARIYDVGRIGGKPYIRMEYIDGYTLEKLREKEGSMTVTRSATVILHILLGLKHAHENGMIHRDLRPQNVILSEKEKKFKIIDFGVSAFLDANYHTQLTRSGENIANGNFNDPLLQQNPAMRDARSDIYSVGAIWYYLLCGRAPSGSDMKEYLEKVCPQVTQSCVDIIMECLSSNIENRYSSCEELVTIVRKLASSKEPSTS